MCYCIYCLASVLLVSMCQSWSLCLIISCLIFVSPCIVCSVFCFPSYVVSFPAISTYLITLVLIYCLSFPLLPVFAPSEALYLWLCILLFPGCLKFLLQEGLHLFTLCLWIRFAFSSEGSCVIFAQVSSIKVKII